MEKQELCLELKTCLSVAQIFKLGTYIITFLLLRLYEKFITQVQFLYSLNVSIYYKSSHRRSVCG
jgi:hypothetical protein